MFQLRYTEKIMTNLQIPYAYTPNKTPVSPVVAEKGQDFSCPICDSVVVLRRGDIRRSHFSHKPDTGCSGEGVNHKTAKQMIYLMYLTTVRTVMNSVTTTRKCPNCSKSVLFFQTPQFDDVACEFDVGKYRVDVVLLRDGEPVSGIEVRDTHPVDDEKWDAFAELEFPCIEVDVQEVIDDWQYDLKGLRKSIPEAIRPIRLDLKAIRHNLHLFYEDLRRVYCDECDKDIENKDDIQKAFIPHLQF